MSLNTINPNLWTFNLWTFIDALYKTYFFCLQLKNSYSRTKLIHNLGLIVWTHLLLILLYIICIINIYKYIFAYIMPSLVTFPLLEANIGHLCIVVLQFIYLTTEAHYVSLLLLWQNTWEQLKGRKIFFGLWLQRPQPVVSLFQCYGQKWSRKNRIAEGCDRAELPPDGSQEAERKSQDQKIDRSSQLYP